MSNTADRIDVAAESDTRYVIGVRSQILYTSLYPKTKKTSLSIN